MFLTKSFTDGAPRPVILCARLFRVLFLFLFATLPVTAQSVNCSGVSAWSASSVNYGIGALVTYSGSEYKCIQSHTSEAGWDPADAPALWQLMGTCSASATSSPTPKPTATATPTASVTPQGAPKSKRQELLNFINSISGRMTMAGEHNRESQQGNFIQTMDNVTGDYPALWGGDFLYEADQIANRQNMIHYEIQGGKGGALISLMYHACPPTQSEACAWKGGVLSSLSSAQWSDLVTNGGQLNNVWKSRLDSIAPYLQQIQNAGLPIIFRPFHEMNQCVFWWACHTGPNGTAKLYQITHDYLTNHWGLTNIVWVWSMQDILDKSTGSYGFNEYDPGAAYWDVMSLDFYDGAGFTTAKYNDMVAYAGNRPIAIGECQQLPTPSQLAAQPRWIYFMGWAELVQQNDSNAAIQSIYWAPDVLTENGNNKMPGW